MPLSLRYALPFWGLTPCTILTRPGIECDHGVSIAGSLLEAPTYPCAASTLAGLCSRRERLVKAQWKVALRAPVQERLGRGSLSITQWRLKWNKSMLESTQAGKLIVSSCLMRMETNSIISRCQRRLGH